MSAFHEVGDSDDGDITPLPFCSRGGGVESGFISRRIAGGDGDLRWDDHRQVGGGADHRANTIGDEHGVGSGIAELSIVDDQRGAIRAGDVEPVESPLQVSN